MNSQKLLDISYKTLKGGASIVLAGWVACEVLHYIPLRDLEGQATTVWNDPEKQQLIADYIALDPHRAKVGRFSSDTNIIVDEKRSKVFTITCPEWSNHYCLLRDNPYMVKKGGYSFGYGVPISRETAILPFRKGLYIFGDGVFILPETSISPFQNIERKRQSI